MCKNRYIPLLLLWLLSAGPPGLSAQTGASKNTIDIIWPQIESRLGYPNSDSTLSAMLAHIRDRCDGEYDCLYQSYHDLMLRLERKFRLLPAIRVCNEIVRIAHEQNDLEAEAGACMNLNRYYGAIGKKHSATINLDNALSIYAQTGNQPAVIHARMTKLEQSLDYRKLGDVLPEMEALLAGAVAKRDTQSATYLHIRLLLHCQTLGRYDEMAKHIEALEKVPLSDPIRSNEYGIAIHAALGRADLARARKNPEEAKRYYQKTLQLCEAEPSRWLEIRVLQSMAELARERRQSDLAKNYLDKAEAKAEKLQLHDLLSRNYELKADIAEAEGRYAEALRYTKEKILNEQKFKEQSAGFEVQNYYLEKEKEQLTLDKENREQFLRSSIALLVLFLSLTVFLALAFLNLRKQKKILVAQNALIRQQADRLENLDAAKSQFFANVSHELRTPLTLLLGPLQTLLSELHLPEKQTRLLQTSVRGAKQLDQLVNELLNVQKLESGTMTLEEKPTLLHDFFQNHLAPFESLAQYNQVDFSWKISADKTTAVYIDRQKCRRLVYNLLANAFRFTPPGGKVAFGLSFEDGLLRMTVADTGSGIHPSDLPYIFDRFFQTNQPGKPVEGGSGIGLALCKEYVRLFGGDIAAESAPGAGTVFRATFPLTRVDPAQAPVEPVEQQQTAAFMPGAQVLETEPLPPASGDPRPVILLVEDNPEIRAYIRLILDETYRLETAENGREALLFLEAAGTMPELVISDIMMPVMDGFQLLEVLKSDNRFKKLPVIFLTARVGREDRLQAFRTGIDDYLLKPFEPEELLVRIGNALRNHDARREWQTVDAGAPTPAPAGWLDELTAVIQAQIGDPQFNIERLAELKGIGRSTLYRRIREETGLSANQLVQEFRLQQARTLLESGECTSLQALADAVGFRTPNYLSRLYRERFGKSPLDQLRNAE